MPIEDTTAPALGSAALPADPSEGALLLNDVVNDTEPTAIEENTTRNAKAIPLGPPKSRGGPGAEKGSENTLPCGCKKDATNLVVCIDGTGNQFGTKNSNVVELYSLLLKNGKQKTWYNSGIGTFAQPSHKFDYYKQRLSSMLDMAVAWNFERIVCGAYRWLSDNYQPGDRIFIFGFSRGAYQARVISAMIDRVGLLHKGNEMQIPFAYDLYRHGRSTRNPPSNKDLGGGTSNPASEGNQSEKKTLWDNFKATFCHRDVKVHFVGAWDTVSSIGIARTPELLPGTTEGMRHVCYFRHALALDERRVKFLPEYAFGGVSEDPEGRSANTQKKYKHPVKEVWFAGSHSDIGGGNVENADMVRSRPPLRWMASEAKDTGLRIKDFKNEFLAIEEVKVVESLTHLWWILEMIPFKQLTYGNSVSTTRRRLHNGHGRKVCVGQKIHISVLQTEDGYSPEADVTTLSTNNGLKNDISYYLKHSNDYKFRQHLEGSNYERARILVMQAAQNRDRRLALAEGQGPMGLEETTAGMEAHLDLGGAFYSVPPPVTRVSNAKLGDIKSTLITVLIEMLKAADSKTALNSTFLHTVIGNIGDTPVQRVQWKRDEDSALISHMLRPASTPDASNVDQDLANTFLRKFTVPIITTDTCGWYQVAFSGDGKRLFSGGQGGTLRIWDAETGEPQGKLETGMEQIISLAAGHSDFCVIGGTDAGKNVQVWKGGELLAKFGHDDDVLSVGLFGEENIVSASYDGSVHLWKHANGIIVKKTEFEGPSRSVVFSSRGNSILSASSQGIKSMKVETKKTKVVTSDSIGEYIVRLAADGNQIVVSSDHIIRVWDANSKKLLAALEGHTDSVFSVCFATNAAGRRFIVSGSEDGLVKVWDAKTYRWRKDLEGHSAGVTSVAFSPDAKRIASADRDGTIMVWECDSF